MPRSRPRRMLAALRHGLTVLGGSLVCTLTCFLVLPLIQAIDAAAPPDTRLTSVDSGVLAPPPPPPEPEPENEPEPEPEPPQLDQEAPPLDLDQLELSLNAGMGTGFMKGDFAVKLDSLTKRSAGKEALFSLADLDQKPRALYQHAPRIDAALRRQTPATVYLLFLVDESGRVQNPVVQKGRSTNPAFEKPALQAIRKWKFEPGKRNGKAVRFRMRIPITFPKS